ncbi:MAG TPA: PEP-CTERM sorting domain-containing protein [Acetobacteraceae bacterium]|nr:PEP-CTERM sorting domain-containing protein [Acetobacteraceae bacterium]
MKKLTYAALLLAGSALCGVTMLPSSSKAAPSPQNGVCPYLPGSTLPVGATDCNVEIFLNSDGSATTIIPHPTPYDGSDDNLVGIINNSGSTIYSLTFNGTSTGTDLFGFDGDGLQTYCSSCGSDPTGYGGKTSSGQFTTFTVTNNFIGTVNFGSNGIANGGTAYFSLEGPPSLNLTPVPTPEPGTLALLGGGLLALGFGRAFRRNRRG